MFKVANVEVFISNGQIKPLSSECQILTTHLLQIVEKPFNFTFTTFSLSAGGRRSASSRWIWV